jgi:hypothetical protein
MSQETLIKLLKAINEFERKHCQKFLAIEAKIYSRMYN